MRDLRFRSECLARGPERSGRAQSRLPIPASAITPPIGKGVPSAKAPTGAETAPARSEKPASARTIELATMKPAAEMNRNSGTTSPARPPQPVRTDRAIRDSDVVIGAIF